MRLHSITNAIFFSSFSVRKKRQKVIQGRCDVLENPGNASRLVLGIFLFHYRTFCHRKNGLRCVVLCYIKQKLFAKVIFPSDAQCKLALSSSRRWYTLFLTNLGLSAELVCAKKIFLFEIIIFIWTVLCFTWMPKQKFAQKGTWVRVKPGGSATNKM